jgi:hypothetical protein
MGFTNYTALDIFTADDADELMRQSVMRFASTAARDSALSGNLEEGMMACTTDSDIFWIYSGGAWKPWWSPPIAFTSFVSGFIVIGNGTFSGSYQYTPSGLRVKWELLFGTTSDIAADAIWTLPTGSFVDAGTSRALGTAIWYDSNADRSYVCALRSEASSADVYVLHGGAGNAGVVDATNPFTLNASNDIMICDITVPVV